MLSYLVFGLSSGATTSSIAFLAILLRSGDPIGPFMKAIAELSTITGMALFARRTDRIGETISIAMGLVLRVVVMSIVNLIVLPIFYARFYTLTAAVLFLPLLGAFNTIQGSISIFGGLFLHKALAGKIPTLPR
jgi:riboflavin transporter FmnP